MSDVFGNVKAFRSSSSESLIHTGSGLTIQGHAAVAMMVVEEVTEALAADYEAQVTIAARNSRRFGQGLDQGDDATAALFEDRPGYVWCEEETVFFIKAFRNA